MADTLLLSGSRASSIVIERLLTLWCKKSASGSVVLLYDDSVGDTAKEFCEKHCVTYIMLGLEVGKYGRRSEHVRNEKVARMASHAAVVWDGTDQYVQRTIGACVEAGLKVHVEMVDMDGNSTQGFFS